MADRRRVARPRITRRSPADRCSGAGACGLGFTRRHRTLPPDARADLNQTFHPDTAATAQHMWDLASHLDRAGHQVTVVSSRVYYGTDRQHEHALDRYGAHITVERVA